MASTKRALPHPPNQRRFSEADRCKVEPIFNSRRPGQHQYHASVPPYGPVCMMIFRRVGHSAVSAITTLIRTITTTPHASVRSIQPVHGWFGRAGLQDRDLPTSLSHFDPPLGAPQLVGDPGISCRVQSSRMGGPARARILSKQLWALAPGSCSNSLGLNFAPMLAQRSLTGSAIRSRSPSDWIGFKIGPRPRRQPRRPAAREPVPAPSRSAP
jgi:hypothetical protein